MGLFFILRYLKNDKFCPLINLINIDILKILFPLIVLYIYILFPTKYFPKLGRIFLVALILFAFFPFMRNFIFFEITPDVFWNVLGNIANVIQIISFLFFSGSLIHLIFKTPNDGDSANNMSQEIHSACDEIISWSDNREPFSKYLSYWEVSNLCYNYGFFRYCIEYLNEGLQLQRWPYYDEAILHYQLACGHSLMREGNIALDHLKKALQLYPYLKKFVLSDEMLKNIKADIYAEKICGSD